MPEIILLLTFDFEILTDSTEKYCPRTAIVTSILLLHPISFIYEHGHLSKPKTPGLEQLC